MRPLARWAAGAAFIGFVTCAIVGIVFSIDWNGRNFLNGDNEAITAVFAVAGAIAGPIFHARVRRLVREREGNAQSE
jgi:hypothetical protein